MTTRMSPVGSLDRIDFDPITVTIHETIIQFQPAAVPPPRSASLNVKNVACRIIYETVNFEHQAQIGSRDANDARRDDTGVASPRSSRFEVRSASPRRCKILGFPRSEAGKIRTASLTSLIGSYGRIHSNGHHQEGT